ncbi:hypothetical protein ACHHYP_06353 [Achlya hypogyna]|uniref:TIR domain-containing protein n=1 Tax=Achlya hypogyna TaxID=1202772 RepID=A0A1V9YUG5_ACHHY|nr:hypothetical protein ACHHYP_06353 [Achlya hypogyna]
MLEPVEALATRFVFISHGSCHMEFARRLKTALWDQGVFAYIENEHQGLSVNDAILKCDAFISVLSEASCASDVFSDQLAFAENREKRIVPVILSPNFFRLAHLYSLSLHTSVVHFNEAIGFQESVDHLFASYPWVHTSIVMWIQIHDSFLLNDGDDDDPPVQEVRNHAGGPPVPKDKDPVA